MFNSKIISKVEVFKIHVLSTLVADLNSFVNDTINANEYNVE